MNWLNQTGMKMMDAATVCNIARRDHDKGASMLHLHELQVLCCIFVVERDREVVGKLDYY